MFRNSLIYLILLIFTASNACAIGLTIGNGTSAITVSRITIGNGTSAIEANVYVGNGTSSDCLTCGTGAECEGLLVCDNFDNLDNWTIENNVSVVTSPVLRPGYNAARILNTAALSNFKTTFTESTEIWGHFIFETSTSLSNSVAIVIIENATTGEDMWVVTYNGTYFQIKHGSVYGTTGMYTLTLNTPYHIYYHFNEDTNIGYVYVSVLEDLSRGAAIASISGGAPSATTMSMIKHSGTGWSSGAFFYGQDYVSTTAITGVPE